MVSFGVCATGGSSDDMNCTPLIARWMLRATSVRTNSSIDGGACCSLELMVPFLRWLAVSWYGAAGERRQRRPFRRLQHQPADCSVLWRQRAVRARSAVAPVPQGLLALADLT